MAHYPRSNMDKAIIPWQVSFFAPNHLSLAVSLQWSGENSFFTTGFRREISKQPQLSLWWCFHSIGCRSRRDSLTRCGVTVVDFLFHGRLARKRILSIQ